jgi:hypothetical protein
MDNKDLLKCSLDELLTERQKAIESDNIIRYKDCNKLIHDKYVIWEANN